MATAGGGLTESGPAGRGRVLLAGLSTWGELAEALDRVDVSLVVWEDGIVRLANRAAGELIGLEPAGLIGEDIRTYIGDPEAGRRVIEDVESAKFDAEHVRRTIVTSRGHPVEMWVTTRVVEVAGCRFGVSLLVPEDQASRLGHHPVRAWMDMVPIALGFADRHWRIEAVSSEVYELLGRFPNDCIGEVLLDWMEPEDAAALAAAVLAEQVPSVFLRIKMAGADGASVDVCVMVAPAERDGETEVRFALVGLAQDYFPATDRVTELEVRLRRIGAEVRAAGVLQTMGALGSADHPALGELTTRQWEIANRIAQGQRVATIAKELYISASTVRNHLAVIFQKFGVHSQAELMERLRRQPADA